MTKSLSCKKHLARQGTRRSRFAPASYPGGRGVGARKLANLTSTCNRQFASFLTLTGARQPRQERPSRTRSGRSDAPQRVLT